MVAADDISMDSECNYIHIPYHESQPATEYYIGVWCPYILCDVTLRIYHSSESYTTPRTELLLTVSQDDTLASNTTRRYIADPSLLDQSSDSIVVEIVSHGEEVPWFNVYMDGSLMSQISYACDKTQGNKAQKGVYLLKKPIHKSPEDQLEVVVGCEDDCGYLILVSSITHQEAAENALEALNSAKDPNQALKPQSAGENLLYSSDLYLYQAGDYEYVEISESIVQMLVQTDPDLSGKRFYYYAAHTTDAVIKAFAYNYDLLLSIFVNIIDTTKYTSEAEWPYPTPEEHNYSTLSSDLISLLIPSGAFLECGSQSSCGLAISITSAVDPPPTTFYMVDILVTQDITKTDLGKVAQGIIRPKEYIYYSVDVSRVQTNLVASVGSMLTQTNDIILFASKGAQERPWEHRPNFTSHNDLMSGLALLQLSQEDMLDNSMQGTWIIGVHSSAESQTSVNFSLSISREEQQVNLINRGSYIPLSLSKGQDFYFYIINYEQMDFFIRSVVTKGSAECFASTINGNLTILENLPSSEHNYWNASFASVQNYLMINQSDPNYCILQGYRGCDFYRRKMTIINYG